MKIVLVVYRYWPQVGGVEKYVHELAKALVSAGHEVNVVAGATEEGFAERETHEGVQIRRFPAFRSPLRARWWFWRNAGLFRQADVIHVSNTHMLEYYWRMLGFLMDRRKVFLTRHGMSYIHPVPMWEKRRAIRSLSLAAGVVHDGAFIGTWLGVKPDLCPDQGLSPTADELDQPDPPVDPPPSSAVFIGRLEPDSGIRTYIDAVRILTRERGRPFSLQVYGDGSLGQELREQVERDNLPVHFHGRTANAQSHIPESCFAFIDGRMAIQEAMARRRLVFSAYVDLLKKDYVGAESFSPYLVAVANAEQLADKVSFYTDNPTERSETMAKAFEHARTLSWQRTADAYVGFWNKCLTRGTLPCSKWQAWKLVWNLNREARRPKGVWALEADAPWSAAALSHG